MGVLKFRRIISLTKVYAVVIKFLHIFVNELVFTFFFLKCQNHFDMKKSPFKNSGNSWGGGGVIKDPLRMENPGGWGGGCKSKSLLLEGYRYFLEPHNSKLKHRRA